MPLHLQSRGSDSEGCSGVASRGRGQGQLSTKRRFANDLFNLTLSDPAVNRYQKSGKDAGEWMPKIDPRGFAETVIRVKQKYGLSIDQRERKALEMALAGGSLTVLPDSLEGQTDPLLEENPLDLWDDNGNGWDYLC